MNANCWTLPSLVLVGVHLLVPAEKIRHKSKVA
jgi:hypothetical protein